MDSEHKEDLDLDQKKLVNKAIGLTLRIWMESGLNAVDADEGEIRMTILMKKMTVGWRV